MTFQRKYIFFISVLVLICALFAPFWTNGSILSWLAGFCYVIYDTFLLVFVGVQVSSYLKQRNPPITRDDSLSLAILVPARNEKLIIGDCLSSLLGQINCINEIIIVDDGSNDGSFEKLKKDLQLSESGPLWHSQVETKIRVLFKSHSGKAHSLNQVLPFLNSDIVVTLDADTILESDALSKMKEAFCADSDLVAAGGVLVPFCKPSLWGRIFQTFQRFEYVRAFLSRQAWMNQRSLLLVSGALLLGLTVLASARHGSVPLS